MIIKLTFSRLKPFKSRNVANFCLRGIILPKGNLPEFMLLVVVNSLRRMEGKVVRHMMLTLHFDCLMKLKQQPPLIDNHFVVISQ